MGAARPLLRPHIAGGQVQIINHTFSHHDLRPMSVPAVRAELERNEDWVQQACGITTRAYDRPPFGRHNRTVDEIAGRAGLHMHGDAERLILRLRGRHHPVPAGPGGEIPTAGGVINLGHANHPTVLSASTSWSR